MEKSLGRDLVPFSGIVTKEKYNILQHRSIGHFTHNKNPLCSAASLAKIEYNEENKLVESPELLGEYLMYRLIELKDIYPLIGNIAGKGFHIGVDLVKNRDSKERAMNEAEQIMYDCLEQGLAFKIIEGNIITLRPSLIITKDDSDLKIDSSGNALRKFR